ncbi:MAG: DUF2723 domain-containing protein [bacterium]|nr:DUF2723 domain-containing protein [bacterium]
MLRSVAPVVGLAAFVLYLLTCCRTVFFGDAGELIAAAHSLGVAHPPGYPLYTALGRLALELPWGEPAFRVNLLAAAAAGGTVALVASMVARQTRSVAASLAAGLGLGVSSPFWASATSAEVYSLHTMLSAALLACSQRYGERASRRQALAAACAMGLGLAHRPTIVLALPAALVLAWPGLVRGWIRARSRVTLDVALFAVVAPAVAVAFYGWMMRRSAGGPAANWGRPDDLGSLVAHVGTRVYANYAVGPAGWLRPDAWWELVRTTVGGFAVVLPALAVCAALSALRRRRSPGGLGLAAAGLALPAALFAMSYATEDVEVLYLPLALALALGGGVGLDLLTRAAGRGRLASGLAACAVLFPLALNYSTNDLSDVVAARDYGLDMLAGVPERGVLFVQGDDSFVLAYLLQVEGLRPDVTIYDRTGVLFRDELAEPGLPAGRGESAEDYRARRERAFVSREQGRVDPRPVLFMSWPGYPAPREFAWEPFGLFYLARNTMQRAPAPPAWSALHAESVLLQARRTRSAFGMTVAATYPLMRGERALFEGRRSEALQAFERAARVGQSETVHNYLGTIYGRLGDYHRAIEQFERAVDRLPVSVRAWNNLALARSLAGDTQGAREAWRRSLGLEPDQPAVRGRLDGGEPGGGGGG